MDIVLKCKVGANGILNGLKWPPNKIIMELILKKVLCFSEKFLDIFWKTYQNCKPATYYSSLFANNNETTFSQKKKNEFHKTWWKHVYTLFVVDSSLHKYEFHRQISFTMAKSTLSLSRGRLLRWLYFVKTQLSVSGHGRLTWIRFQILPLFV